MPTTDVPAVQRDAASRNWHAFHRAWFNGHKDYVQKAETFNDYYLGDQWDDATRRALEDDGRPALTLNEILQVINAVIGHYGETRADIQFKPRRGDANAETAHVLTRLVDHVLERNCYVDHVEPRVFEDGLIEDRGYVEVKMDFTDNVLGEVRLAALDPRQVLPDPDSDSADPADWKQVLLTKWLSLDDIEAFYGRDKRRKVESLATTPTATFGDLSIKYQSFGDGTSHFDHTTGDDEVKAVRVIERQYRKMSRAQELVDPASGMTRAVPDHWGEERTREIAGEHGLFLRTRTRSRIRWCVSADHIVLHDDWSPYSDFTIVPYFPMYRRGRPSGLVRHLIDPQEQLNKIESQVLHTINTTANSGWLVEAGSLVNMTEQELAERGAQTGLTLVYGRNRTMPEKITPNQVPTGLESFAQKAGHYIHSIPGASALLGHNPPTHVSGVALDRAQGKALLGLQLLFNNLDWSRKLVARRVLDCIQTYYSEHRVYYVTNWRDPEAPEEEVEINQRDAAGRVANDVTAGVYDVVAGSTPTRDTWEEQQFAQLLELREAGVVIPDHHVILNSQIAGKEAIAEQVKAMQGLGEPGELEQQRMRLEMARAEAEVSKLQAQAAEMETRAQHNAARAQTEVAGEEREAQATLAQYKMELARLRADLMKKRQDLENKLEVASIHAGVKEGLTRYEQQLKRQENRRDRDARLEQERIKARAQLGQSEAAARGAITREAMHEDFELTREAMRARATQGERDLSRAAQPRRH